MLVPSLICLTIWIWSMISTGGLIFPWPVFVIIGTGGYLSRLVIGRESAIEEEREKLRKKQARQLIIEQGGPANRSTPAQDELEAGATADEDDLQDDSDPRPAPRSLALTRASPRSEIRLAKSANLGHTVSMSSLAVIIA